MTYKYKFMGDAAEVRIEVTTYMMTLGDQPHYVHLFDLGDDLLLNESPSVYETSTSREAAWFAVQHWLKSQGLPLAGKLYQQF